MNHLADEHIAKKYDEMVDQWVLDAVSNGVQDFWQLVDSLPGVYPSVALAAVRRLSSGDSILQTLLDTNPRDLVDGRHSQDTDGTKDPIPQHPLAYDWRFSNLTAGKLMVLALELANDSKTVALLGAPTLYRLASQRGFPGRFLLVDRNPVLKRILPQTSPHGIVETLDITSGPALQGSFQVVVADPPWYEDYIKGFLWFASRLGELNGHILLSFPPLGTRPGISEEWDRLMKWIPEVGLELVRVEEGALLYLTPPFEHNAMLAEGFQYVPRAWRKGNLVTLKRLTESEGERPALPAENRAWTEFTIDSVSLWVRQSSSVEFQDPTLRSIVPGDVLPTVSSRDSRREAADIWTSGNRIFACAGSNVLASILQSIVTSTSPELNVAEALGRTLSYREQELVLKAAERIQEIIRLESKEMGNALHGN